MPSRKKFVAWSLTFLLVFTAIAGVFTYQHHAKSVQKTQLEQQRETEVIKAFLSALAHVSYQDTDSLDLLSKFTLPEDLPLVKEELSPLLTQVKQHQWVGQDDMSIVSFGTRANGHSEYHCNVALTMRSDQTGVISTYANLLLINVKKGPNGEYVLAGITQDNVATQTN
ncbi:hypothetical protein JJB07_07785 [Tumebacillus sp. ITR2]|uniref:DUF4019 domain-containing protein n=1 Tax=Tumebacillus amylolyticus TaxID=2801339 RepID=A0ABS1J8D9_9BACL|nr:hypothetical protein [Tumebacillus amylolyticus]MBL0386547.1 hypothetical protein [Tumebacillus amylolyticus]